MLAVAPVVRRLHGDGLRADLLERGVLVPTHGDSGQTQRRANARDLPDQVLGGDDGGADCVAEGVQLDSLVGFEVLFAKEDIEIGVFLD